MKTKHTEGEWHLEKWESSPAGFTVVSKETNNIIVCVASGKTNEEIESNAKLIAAAPNMLEALQEIEERLKGCSNFPLTANEVFDSFYKEIIESAIKKATL